MARIWYGRLAGLLAFGTLGSLFLPSAGIANGGPPLSTTWTGSQSTDWFDGANWTDGIPDANDVAINQTPTAVIAGGGSAQTRQVTIGDGVGQTGRLLVDGSGSNLATADGTGLIVGSSGSGEMTIRNGASVRVGGPSYIAALAGSDGTVTVRDAGSTWTIRGTLSLGFLQTPGARTATLAILNGGRVSAGGVEIGRGESTSSVRIAGRNSVLSSRDTLVLGDIGTSVLTIADAGRVAVGGGTGAVTIAINEAGSGTLNIGAAEGDTPLAAGALDAATLAFGDGDGTIVFNHTDTGYTFVPAISGDGVLRFLSGRTILTGDSSGFIGTTALSGGELVVNGTLRGSTTFADGTRLSGTGRLGPTVLNSGATVAPGNSIGTLTVDGDLTFNGGTVYEVEVDPAGTAADRITVNGTAFLAGAVSHIGETGAYRPTADYVILTATDGFDGTRFDDVESDFHFLDPALLYETNTVILRLVRNDIEFASVARTRNQRAAGTGADSLALGNSLYDALAVLTAPAAPGALDKISGEIHASAQSALIEQTGQLRRSIPHRIDDGGDGVTVANGRVTTWAHAFGTWSRADSDGNAAAMDHDQRGILVGGDVLLDTAGETETRLGAFAGSGRSDISADDRLSSATAHAFHLGVYGGTAAGPWRISGGAAHSWHQIETDRIIAFTGFADSPTASYSARTTQVFAEAGYELDLDPIALQPFAGLTYTSHTVSSFAESGGAAALAVSGADQSATHGALGLRASGAFDIGGTTATLHGSIAWQHLLNDETPSSRSAFGGGSAFTVYGAPLARDSALIETGFDIAVTEALSFGASYDGRFDADGHDHGVRGRLALLF